jgi:predicted  nucleic acid-binding Zn-ribbon protein
VLEEVEGWRKANDDLARRLDRAQIDIEAWKRAHQTLQERLHKAQSDVRLWKDANARQADSNQEHLKNVRAQRDDAYKRISELTTALAAIDASIRGLSIDLQPPVRRW